MTLHILQSADEHLLPEPGTRLLARAVAQGAPALVLCPSVASALEVQRELACAPATALGIECASDQAWVRSRWGLYGDGRALVAPAQRVVLMARLLTQIPQTDPLDTGDGTVDVLCQLVSRALPWLPALDGERAGALSAGQARALEIAHAYRDLLAQRKLVEPCEAAQLLPGLMSRQGAQLPVCVFAGYAQAPRALRELVCAYAQVGEAMVALRCPEGPAGGVARAAAAELACAARTQGIEVTTDEQGGFRAPRTRELSELLGCLYRPEESGVIEPAGAVSLLEPAGPLATYEVVAAHIEGLAAGGARKVVVVAPDAKAAWMGLAPKLYARGLSVRAGLSQRACATRCGAGFMRLAADVARLTQLAQVWPQDPAEPAPDMSWWPPRDTADFLLSPVSGVGAQRAWRRDSTWRGNRILTPATVLKNLMNPSASSPSLASAVRELEQGHIAAAAQRLLAGLRQQDAELASARAAGASGAPEPAVPDGGAPAEGDGPNAAAAPEPAAMPSAEEVLARAQDEACLTAISETGRALREAGVALGEDGVDLTCLVDLARQTLGHMAVCTRPALVCEASVCEVAIMTPAAAAQEPCGSADALVYLGLDAASSPIPVADGALDLLLEALGIDCPQDGLARARADFAQILRVPTGRVALVCPARDHAASETFPAVMLSEVLSCYGAGSAATKGKSLLVPLPSSRRDEGLVEENLGAGGAYPEVTQVPGRGLAGQLDPALRRLVVVPRDGQAELPGGRPSLSASQIESYLECPYKWFTLRRLGLEDCDAGFSNMEMGTFAHRVLEVTHRELFLEAARRQGLVGQECAEHPEEGLFWFEPAVRVAGSRVSPENLEHAQQILRAEFAEHLMHQRLEGSRRSSQALIPHTHTEQRRLDVLEQDLLSALEFEAPLLEGFEPRLFEGRFGGSTGLVASYAGADLVGTIDRIDVDAEGRALVIDYKHKSSLFDEYALKGKQESDWAAGFVAPRRVQTLIYASVARELLRDAGVEVVGALYLGTKGNHQLAGAVSARDAGAVWGAQGLRERDLERVTLPVPGARDFNELLDRTEEHIARALQRMREGDIEARPIAKDACAWCPALNCNRRQS